MIRSTGLLGLLGVGALLLSLTACTSGTEVNTSQDSTTRELVLVQGPDPTSRALGHAYRLMLGDAGIKARLGEPAADPIAEVLAGRADAAVAGSSELLAALGQLPGATGADSTATEAQGTASGAPGEGSAPGETPPAADTTDGAPESAPEVTGEPVLDAAQAKRALHALELDGFAVLDSAEAERTGALVVTAATSAGEQLTGVGQLGPLCPELDFGIPAANRQLAVQLAEQLDCLPRKVIELSGTGSGSVLPVISDAVQVQATTVENSGIPDNALVVLADAGVLFAPEPLTPLITTDGVGRDAIKAINKLSGALKQEDLLALNRMVTGRDALDPQQAAADWLAEKSLLGTGS